MPYQLQGENAALRQLFWGGWGTVLAGAAVPCKGDVSGGNKWATQKGPRLSAENDPLRNLAGCATTGGGTGIEGASGAKSGYVTGLTVPIPDREKPALRYKGAGLEPRSDGLFIGANGHFDLLFALRWRGRARPAQ